MVIFTIIALIASAILWACCKVSSLSPEEEKTIQEYIDFKR